MSTCKSCGGSGLCQNRFHYASGPIDSLSIAVEDAFETECPACGQKASNPGSCSACGGSGEKKDD